MRLVFVVITGLILLTIITLSWYIFQPMCWQTITFSQTILSGMGLSTDDMARAIQTNSLLYWVNLLWGPVADLFVLLWMVISAQRVDPTSEVYW